MTMNLVAKGNFSRFRTFSLLNFITFEKNVGNSHFLPLHDVKSSLERNELAIAKAEASLFEMRR